MFRGLTQTEQPLIVCLTITHRFSTCVSVFSEWWSHQWAGNAPPGVSSCQSWFFNQQTGNIGPNGFHWKLSDPVWSNMLWLHHLPHTDSFSKFVLCIIFIHWSRPNGIVSYNRILSLVLSCSELKFQNDYWAYVYTVMYSNYQADSVIHSCMFISC